MISIVGMGPGHRNYLTEEAVQIIQEADIVVAFGRIAETARLLTSRLFIIDRVSDITSYVTHGERVAILASGDPGFYGILEYIKKQQIPIDNVVPGISSSQYMMARLQKSWHHAKFLSLHGREETLEVVKHFPLCIVLTDKIHTPDVISKRLRTLGIQGRLYVGYDLSYDNERIITTEIGNAIAEDDSLAVVVIEHDMDS